MKKWLLLAFILILLALANPSKSEYKIWLKEEAVNHSTNIFERGISELIFSDKLLDSATTSNNYVFFSVYTTNLIYRELKFIGILNNFFPLKIE